MEVSAYFDIFWRTMSTLIVLFALTRLLGKKQLSQLSLFEYAVGITVGNIAAGVSIGLKDHFLPGIFSLFLWMIVPFLLRWASIKSRKFREWMLGKPTVVIENGKIQEDNLAKQKYSVADLMQLLRRKNVFSVADVEFAVLETSGDLSVLMKKEKQPPNAADLGLKPAPEKQPHTVILEGQVQEEELRKVGYNHVWLKTELEKLNVALENVYIGQVDSYGQLSVDIYDDQIQIPAGQERQLLLATIKKCQADLELFSLATDSKEAKAMYDKNAKRLEKMIVRLSRFLQP
ncbi:hypothetical protein BpJC7_24010 [Weizmannia acidilactici]|uniref:YetF C-terminal domain-containing protein n=1 Tax=Weizmannia acidilactici TaxID=2607726 RepID=A0A5J4JKM9_9BACI|nr:DUF421 domain-containing protein [Weizmannia acidilactici]GER68259.1 hypothetical protein BpJC4_27300 [Weizmannia acidilactici]GER71098.1 hypothetical protein BpJC7_24010 [Weizmannia acidilactici]GER74520.1 hypothetical protein BpPP18_25870 [Weizmannia acidilactici]